MGQNQSNNNVVQLNENVRNRLQLPDKIKSENMVYSEVSGKYIFIDIKYQNQEMKKIENQSNATVESPNKSFESDEDVGVDL